MKVLRPVVVNNAIKGCRRSTRCSFPSQSRPYQSSSYTPPLPFTSAETAILSSALCHVPEHGFTHETLARGALDAGYREVSTNLFPKGAYDLVNYHLVTQRLGLKDGVQFPDATLGTGAKVRALMLGRLRGNAAIIHKWQEALAIMARPSNAIPAMRELARLADEIWFLAGDTSVDFSWYTKRTSLSVVYSSTELYMTTDTSPGFLETEQFLDRRLEELGHIRSNMDAIGEWTKYTAQAAVNVARSKGVRI